MDSKEHDFANIKKTSLSFSSSVFWLIATIITAVIGVLVANYFKGKPVVEGTLLYHELHYPPYIAGDSGTSELEVIRVLDEQLTEATSWPDDIYWRLVEGFTVEQFPHSELCEKLNYDGSDIDRLDFLNACEKLQVQETSVLRRRWLDAARETINEYSDRKHAFRHTRPPFHDHRRPAGVWSLSIENSGNALAQDVRVALPHSEYAIISSPALNTTSRSIINNRIEIGTLQPGETAAVMAWTQRRITPKYDYNNVLITHTTGTARPELYVNQRVAPSYDAKKVHFVFLLIIAALIVEQWLKKGKASRHQRIMRASSTSDGKTTSLVAESEHSGTQYTTDQAESIQVSAVHGCSYEYRMDLSEKIQEYTNAIINSRKDPNSRWERHKAEKARHVLEQPSAGLIIHLHVSNLHNEHTIRVIAVNADFSAINNDFFVHGSDQWAVQQNNLVEGTDIKAGESAYLDIFAEIKSSPRLNREQFAVRMNEYNHNGSKPIECSVMIEYLIDGHSRQTTKIKLDICTMRLQDMYRTHINNWPAMEAVILESTES